ncbi:MAG TPA: methylated-DNA--[protein]-cysteine S-methyltransferase [Myxococcales bacterium]|nr:methylated-DNA--[protein]-cysteine S-methyltransferase [Myxococcales bacterium]HIN85701.1 methylated-DNA--[protein]-cysteine S-methyltransferase [Myxococcales bacterium]
MNDQSVYDLIEWSPVNLMLTVCHGELIGVNFLRENEDPPREIPRDPEAAKFATSQVQEYLSGKRKSFDLPLTLHGSPFQVGVWMQLRQVPYGQLQSYSEVARAMGRYGASRAVGGAVRRNRLPIIIPCHRITSKNGPGGFTGGLDIKKALLEIEGVTLEDE